MREFSRPLLFYSYCYEPGRGHFDQHSLRRTLQLCSVTVAIEQATGNLLKACLVQVQQRNLNSRNFGDGAPPWLRATSKTLARAVNNTEGNLYMMSFLNSYKHDEVACDGLLYGPDPDIVRQMHTRHRDEVTE